MALMFIDTREQRPLRPPHEPRRHSLRPLLPFPIAMFLLGIAGMVPPLPAYLLILGAAALIARTLAKLIPVGNGLKDHRQ